MKNKIVWILKLDSEHKFVGIGFLRRKLVWCEGDKIQQISLGDSIGKFWIITTLARDWKVPAVSDDAALTIWTTEMTCALSSKEPFVIDVEEAKMRGKYLNPRAKREFTKFFQPESKMFQQN
jgi:hypothetical protein